MAINKIDQNKPYRLNRSAVVFVSNGAIGIPASAPATAQNMTIDPSQVFDRVPVEPRVNTDNYYSGNPWP